MLPLAFPFCPVLSAQEDSTASRQQVPSSASGLGLVPLLPGRTFRALPPVLLGWAASLGWKAPH